MSKGNMLGKFFLPKDMEREIKNYLEVDDLPSIKGTSKYNYKSTNNMIDEKNSSISYSKVSLLNQSRQKKITFNLMRLINNIKKINPNIDKTLIEEFTDYIKILRHNNAKLLLTYLERLNKLIQTKLQGNLTQNKINDFAKWTTEQFKSFNWEKLYGYGGLGLMLTGTLLLCVSVPGSYWSFKLFDYIDSFNTTVNGTAPNGTAPYDPMDGWLGIVGRLTPLIIVISPSLGFILTLAGTAGLLMLYRFKYNQNTEESQLKEQLGHHAQTLLDTLLNPNSNTSFEDEEVKLTEKTPLIQNK